MLTYTETAHDLVPFLLLFGNGPLCTTSHSYALPLAGAGYQPVVGEDVDRTLSKNQHILNIEQDCT